MIDKIPIKEKRNILTTRFLHYLVFIQKNDDRIFTALNKRNEKDIWKGLYEFPLVESGHLMKQEDLVKNKQVKKISEAINMRIVNVSGPFRHILSHRILIARYFVIRCDRLPDRFLMVEWQKLQAFPVPKLMEKLINHINITFFDLND